ncbi:polymorphic outer membrane protein, partial [Chlamydia psittaci 03DC29]
HYI